MKSRDGGFQARILKLEAERDSLLAAAERIVSDPADCWCVKAGEVPGVAEDGTCGFCELRAAIKRAT